MTDKPSNDRDQGDPDQSVADAKPKDDDGENDDAQFADLNMSAESAPGEAAPSRLPLLLSGAALLLAGLALAIGTFRSVSAPGVAADDDGAAAEQIASLSAALDSRESQLDELQRQLERLNSRAAPAPVDVDGIERRIQSRVQDRLRLMESVPARVASLESALTALRGISTGARDAWLLAEAEYYLQIANSQLQLAGNPELAMLAMRLADERLVELGDPGLTDVRRTLSEEIRSLEALEAIDIEGATLALAGLSREVDDLPLQARIVLVGRQTAKPAAELTGTDRALATLRNAMSDVIDVRRTDEAARPLIAPDAVYFLRANLSLQLQAARLAMLRGEQALFQQSLDDATSWLREYYDTESASVRSALQTISDIRQSAFTRALPDISGSLRRIREYIAFIEASRVESAGAAARQAPREQPATTATQRRTPAVTRPAAARNAAQTQPPEPASTPAEPPQDDATNAAAETAEATQTANAADDAPADSDATPAAAELADNADAPEPAEQEADSAVDSASANDDGTAESQPDNAEEEGDTPTTGDAPDPDTEPPQ